MKLKHLLALSLLALGSVAAPALRAADAAPREIAITANDAMQFNLKEITAAPGEKIAVKLSHIGKLPKTAMGHNWVLSKTADMPGIATDGIPAGPDASYLKAGDERVIAHTDLIGGGESTSVTFDVSKLAAGEDYSFFCSFPGHYSMMKGSVKLVD